MKKLPVTLFLSLTLALPVAFTHVHAAPIVNVTLGGTHIDQIIGGIRTDTATGATMAGMAVIVFYGYNPGDTKTWVDAGPGEGGAFRSGSWWLFQEDDSFSGPWSLNNDRSDAAITRIMIDGGAAYTGDTVLFDMHHGSGELNTAGSHGGGFFGAGKNNFQVVNSNFTGTIDVTYSGAVGILDAKPRGDLFRFLTIEFGGAGFTHEHTLEFGIDTDMVAGATTPVPLPGAALLFGTGLLALAGIAKRRNNSNKTIE